MGFKTKQDHFFDILNTKTISKNTFLGKRIWNPIPVLDH